MIARTTAAGLALLALGVSGLHLEGHATDYSALAEDTSREDGRQLAEVEDTDDFDIEEFLAQLSADELEDILAEIEGEEGGPDLPLHNRIKEKGGRIDFV